MRPLAAHWLGRARYGEVHALQAELQAARIEGRVPDLALVVEHEPVITLGRAARREHVLVAADALVARGIELHEVGRGGDVTYHGPGQLVVYPIVDLKPDRCDVRRYVWTLEEAMVRHCATEGLTASRVAGLNGAWVGGRKIGAVGVRIRKWVTMHGLALNVTTDLDGFSLIVPCGIRGRGVTSLAAETGRAPEVRETGRALVRELAALLDRDAIWHDGAPSRPPASPWTALGST